VRKGGASAPPFLWQLLDFERRGSGAGRSVLKGTPSANAQSGTPDNGRRFLTMSIEFYFTPELHLRDGRVIRDLDDAAGFAREQELRPGIDQRDEVLHQIERAETREHAHAAAHSFVPWLEELDVLE
jgi:hypothetical protein